jgi:ornithine lipid ester-linked acyl 2-hydroxylase
MEQLSYTWPEAEELVYLRPPKEEYNGKLSYFYSPSCFPELKVLKKHWKQIRDEIIEYEKNQGELNGMSSLNPAGVIGGNWTLIYLKSFNRIFKNNRKKFPITTKILDQIPNCVLSSISVLPANVEISPHYGDTNGIVRVHLGLIVPEKYPIIGMKVGNEEKGWEEGELLCFINVQKHNVWNKSSKRRYVIMLDIVPEPLIFRKDEICVKGLGSQTFNFFYNKFKLFRALPSFIHDISVVLFTSIWKIYLPIERFINEKM